MSMDIISDKVATLFTRSECALILEKAVGENDKSDKVEQLIDFKIELAQDAIGFLGEYYRLTLRSCRIAVDKENSNAVKHFFVKSLGNPSEPEKEKIFKKEANLYDSLLKDLQKFSTEFWCPKSYLSRNDLIVMQDLKELGYISSTNMDENLTDRQMKQILRGLAALHASSIAYEVKNELSIAEQYTEMLEEITVAPNIAWYTTGLKAVLAAAKQHPKYQSAQKQHFVATSLDRHVNKVYQMVNSSQKYRNVLCHRDPWLGNIFFHNSTSPEEIKSAVFVDYQTCRYCPPSIDLIFAIFMNLPKQQRKLKEVSYVQLYYHYFTQDLKQFHIKAEEYISERELLSSYREYELFGCVYKAIAATILKVPKEFVTNEYKHIESVRTRKVLEYMQENMNFRNHLEECIEEMIELMESANI